MKFASKEDWLHNRGWDLVGVQINDIGQAMIQFKSRRTGKTMSKQKAIRLQWGLDRFGQNTAQKKEIA